MYTSLLSLSLLLAPAANTPAWQPSYAAALDVAQKHGKPVAVFVGSGPKGVGQIVKEGQLSEETLRVLASHYVCVFVDRTNGGKRLAQDFGISQDSGIVISDRTGSYQAYHHDGRLAQAELGQRLRQYADPALVVTRTVSNGRISYYGESVPRSTFTPSIRVQNC